MGDFTLALEQSRIGWLRELRRRGALKGSLFAQDDGLFLYVDTADEQFDWEWPTACKPMLETWPGGRGGARLTVPMLAIYRDGEPSAYEDRQGGQRPRERIGSLARLKPDMYAGYIFYHYAKQEETPNSFNPSYIIGAHEELIFSYEEKPAPPFGSRQTRRTWPAAVTPDNWHELMRPHFIPWTESGQEPVLWVRMQTILHF